MKALLDLLRVGFVLSAVALSIHSAYALPPMPNFDKRLDQRGAATGLNGDQEKARSRPAARLPALLVDVDPIIGSPAWIISTEDFLSGFTEHHDCPKLDEEFFSLVRRFAASLVSRTTRHAPRITDHASRITHHLTLQDRHGCRIGVRVAQAELKSRAAAPLE